MFTGIIKEIGTIIEVKRGAPWVVSIEALTLASTLFRGDSFSVSGACLTIIEVKGTKLLVEISKETLKRTTFENLKASDRVNLEPALSLSSKLDGHIVQGHIDGVGTIVHIEGHHEKMMTIKPLQYSEFLIVDKGSIAVDGVSLTVASIDISQAFTVSLIPLTLEETTLGKRRTGDRVNLEYDIIGKYVAQRVKIR
jgi:riboflavin synthase